MRDIDILFLPDDTFSGGILGNGFADDLNLRTLLSVACGIDSEEFINALCHPLISTEHILQRQAILSDFLENRLLAENLLSICANAEKIKPPVYNTIYRSVEPKRKLVDNLNLIDTTFKVLQDLFETLSKATIKSVDLAALRDKCNMAKQNAEIKGLIMKEAAIILSSSHCFRLRFSSINKLISVTPDLSFSSTKDTKKSISKSDSFGYSNDFEMQKRVDYTIETCITTLSGIIATINHHVRSFCRSLSKQIEFYINSAKVYRFLSSRVPVAFPVFSDEYGIDAEKLFSCELLFENVPIVNPNDVKVDNKHIYFVSGENQGGKTTFVKSIAFAQLLAQNGLPVPAEIYRCRVFDCMITHFPSVEDADYNRGKLSEELHRLKENLQFVKSAPLIIFNESFATTTEFESTEIAVDCIKALSTVGPVLFFVTHNYFLLSKLKDYFGDTAKSLVAITHDNHSERAYRITEAPPAQDIATDRFINELLKRKV